MEEICFKMEDTKKQNVIKMAALGRQLKLGDLYDYYTDIIIKGQCWEFNDMTSATLTNTNFKLKLVPTEFESNKWDHIGLDDHLKASTMFGLIDKFRGASTYLKVQKNPAQITRTVVCRIKSKKEQFELATLMNQGNVPTTNCEGEKQNNFKEATHVVVSVVYGAEIYCVLTRDLVDETNQDAKDDAKDELTSWANKMESALDGTQTSIEFKEQFDQEERKTLTRMKCRLYTDILIPTLHECSYFDAYQICLKLIEQIKQNSAKSKLVPINFELFPLNMIINSAVAIAKPINYRKIESHLTERCCRILGEIEETRAKAEISRISALKHNHNSLKEFVIQIDRYLKCVRTNLKQCIIRARKIEGNDKAFEKVIQEIENHSLFKPNRLKQWLDYKTSEVEMMKKMNQLSGIIFLATDSQLEKEMNDSFDKKYFIVLQVPALDENTNHILKAMKDYLMSVETCTEISFDDKEYSENLPWHMIRGKQEQVLHKIREFSNHLNENKEYEKQVQFCITPYNKKKEFSCQYSIYENGQLLNEDVQLPGPPTDLEALLDTTSESSRNVKIRLEWKYQDVGYPRQFLIEHRLKDSLGSWTQQKTMKPYQTHFIVNCKRGSVMEFRVAAVTCIGRSNFSKIVQCELDQFLHKINRPVIPSPIGLKICLVTKNMAQLVWLPALALNDDDVSSIKYIVQYWQIGLDSTYIEVPVGFETEFQLEHLQHETAYSVQVVAVSEENERSPPCDKLCFMTCKKETRLAEAIAKNCENRIALNGMDLLTVPLNKRTEPQSRAERYYFGSQTKDEKQNKTILIMGATGSGKSTLINAMINYIFGVEWKDTFRFQLIPTAKTDWSEKKCETNKITAYDIHHIQGFRIPFSLTIVDTPGYGNSKGLDHDHDITEMVQNFFDDKNGIQKVDVVGFVAQASLPRLTPMQIYIFDSVLSIFGKDIKENIKFLLTFADTQTPSVLSAISAARLPCSIFEDGKPLYHKFNNSGIFSSNCESINDSVDPFQMYRLTLWHMGCENFKRFFSALGTMKSKSLLMTRQVLETRKKLTAAMVGFDSQSRKVSRYRNYEFNSSHTIDSQKENKQKKIETQCDQTVLHHIQLLDEIALHPSPYSKHYYDVIIDNEYHEKRNGFKSRIESLKKMKQRAIILNKIQNIKNNVSQSTQTFLRDDSDTDYESSAENTEFFSDEEQSNYFASSVMIPKIRIDNNC